ncbi:uncharacterized protein LOC126742958 [Anthonomus grandis grandis]|uniref:uncharacterized protein LOC126742958 n=1 Tax=Anthonomus grandis grandis TaxID=2921223 RepID=UPI002165A3A8|nr:uncharacterized protein LOC126742958 [Anthonomus grandis grandis]
MKLFIAIFVVMCVVAGVSANCGCLKCSKHLQSIDIPGPDGQSIRVIFERPQCQCQQSNSYSPINTQQKPKCSGTILAPTAPKPPARLLKNLKYKTTTVRVPPPSPPPPPPPPPPAPATPEPVPEQEIPAELLQFLLSLSATPEATAAAVAAVPSTCGCCSCRNKREVCECGESCSCPICQKQSLLGY